ncbi:MAG: DUF2252 domain-containing protein [Actinobacteria bacterium]|nr:MAG: DUF2252 domain-containing protein [Actinomycetota bacterium]
MVAVDEEKQAQSASAPAVEHFTASERAARGRSARAECPRSSHAGFELAPDRDPVAILEAQASSRVPELVPVRYGRMLVSPFTFYRGAAAVMAHDLASTPRAGLRVQLCGDAHLSNVGGYASPERTLVFDLNDFDETLPGPFEWDVKRLAASFEIAGRDRDFTDTERARAVLNVVRSYREWMRKLAEARNLDVWYARLDVETLERNLREQQATHQAANVAKAAEKARTKDSLKAFAKLTQEVDGEPRIVSDPPLIVSAADLAQEAGIQFERLEGVIHELFREYRETLQSDRRHLLEEFRMVDLARKVVGVGSVGTRCWIVLLLGRDGDDPLFLQIKEAQASVLEPYLGKSEYENHGERVVAGQQLMQATSDIFLGWLHSKETLDGAERDFFVRQLWDWKTSVDLDTILPTGLELYGEVCGFLLARAHARSGDRIAIASYLGKSDSFDRALAEFAVAYADQNERDHAAVRQAADEGRIAVREGL